MSSGFRAKIDNSFTEKQRQQVEAENKKYVCPFDDVLASNVLFVPLFFHTGKRDTSGLLPMTNLVLGKTYYVWSRRQLRRLSLGVLRSQRLG